MGHKRLTSSAATQCTRSTCILSQSPGLENIAMSLSRPSKDNGQGDLFILWNILECSKFLQCSPTYTCSYIVSESLI